MSEKNIQALAIKSSSHPPGVEYEWKAIPSIQEFTKNIIIPEVAGAEEGGTFRLWCRVCLLCLRGRSCSRMPWTKSRIQPSEFRAGQVLRIAH